MREEGDSLFLFVWCGTGADEVKAGVCLGEIKKRTEGGIEDWKQEEDSCWQFNVFIDRVESLV